MDGRRAWLPLITFALVASLSGCGDAITVHPLARYLDVDPDVPPVAGSWIARNDDGDVAVLDVEGGATDRQRCREATIHYKEGADDTVVGDQVCFLELNGHLIAELRIGEPYEVYRQYLVRVSEERIETCGLWPVWVMLQELARDRPVGYSLDSLQYTEREQGESKLLVFISQPRAMRDFLELALPELAFACDSGGEEFNWMRFERMSPDETPAEEQPETAEE